MVLLIGVLSMTLVLFLTMPPLRLHSKASQHLSEMHSLEVSKKLQDMDQHDLAYYLIAAGVNISPFTFRCLCLGAGACVLIIVWMFLPGIPSLILAAITTYLPYHLLQDKVKHRALSIERVMPVAVGRIASGLLAGGGLPQVLEETARSLDVEGTNPLSAELLLTASELNVKARSEALSGLARRSPSPSLSNLAFLLQSYLESGGGKYSEVLLASADRIQKILVARNRAVAKAGDALLSARVIPGVLALVILSLSSDPMIGASLRSFPVQILLGLTIVSMLSGYLIMRSMITEVA